MENVNGDKVVEYKVDVVAKDNAGNVLGKGKCPAFSLDEKGQARATKHYGIKEFMILFNAKIKADARNDLARVKSVAAQVKAKEKSDSAFAAEIKALRAKWGING